jgi:SWI/SNF-related matrix-associated actin-dependent regulator 1 of chromatin subfamily A
MASLTYRNGEFIWRGGYETRHIPKSAGFRWDPARRVWWTSSTTAAAALATYADAAARAALQPVQERERLSRATEADLDVPAPPGRTYLPYQKAGVRFLLDTKAVLLADEMGLGKTIQILGLVNASPDLRNILVVCPASLRLNWAREAERWLVRPLPIYLLLPKEEVPDGEGLFIVHYDVLDRFSALFSRTWDLLVVDEAHYIKNPKAKRTKLVRSLKANRKALLTGTPIVNRPVELFPLISFLDSKNWGNFWKFAERYCAPKHNGFGWDFSGASNLDELQRKLRQTVMIRRLKKDVLAELPPKTRQIIEIPANGASSFILEEQRKVEEHAEILAALRAAVEMAKTAENDEEYKEAVQKLRKAAALAFEEISECRHRTALAKVPYVVEHIREALESEDKIVVFAHHKDVIHKIAEEFRGEVVVITGDTPLPARQEAVDRFQNDPKVRVIVASILAAGVGLTLTAARVAVFAELDWVPGNITQAEDRLHRVGQTENVLIQHLVLEGSIDARLAYVITHKQTVIKAALDAEKEDSEEEVSYLDAVFFPEKTKKEERPSITRDRIAEVAAKISPEQAQIAHEAIRYLAELDFDRAKQRNEMGFNKIDSAVGHRLAILPALTARQAALAAIVALRYHRQLPGRLVEPLRLLLDPADEELRYRS